MLSWTRYIGVHILCVCVRAHTARRFMAHAAAMHHGCNTLWVYAMMGRKTLPAGRTESYAVAGSPSPSLLSLCFLPPHVFSTSLICHVSPPHPSPHTPPWLACNTFLLPRHRRHLLCLVRGSNPTPTRRLSRRWRGGGSRRGGRGRLGCRG